MSLYEMSTLDASNGSSNTSAMSSSSLVEGRAQRKKQAPKGDLSSPVLISLVSQKPCVWDFNLEAYHNTNARSAAWEDIAKKFHSTSAAECLEHWNKLRNNLRQNEARHEKATRSGAKATRLKPYVYAKQMSFLKVLKSDMVEIQQGNADEDVGSFLKPSHTSSPLKEIQNIFEPKSLKYSSDSLTGGSENLPPSPIRLKSSPVRSRSSLIKLPSPSKLKSKNRPVKRVRKNNAAKVSFILPAIAEEDENETLDEEEDTGLIPPKLSKKIRRQKQLNEKREEQCAKIAQKVKASKLTSRPSFQPERHFLENLIVEEDRFSYFAMSLVQPLRSLPPQVARELCLSIMSQTFQAEAAAEKRKLEPEAGEDVQPETKVNGPMPLSAKQEVRNPYPNLLSYSLKAQVDTILLNKDVTTIGFGLTLKFEDFQTLMPYVWLTDNALSSPNGVELVLKWTENVDLLSLEMMVVPVHQGDNHWCLAVLNFKEKKAEYFDSLQGRNPQCLEMLFRFLEKAALSRKMPFEIIEWDRIHRKDIPLQ
ncbi:hypothetical protein ONE63_007301 [Megalurothrips usitatus]|uniref:Uncharacterized protein n=1 Tax=Megalurothrips usitatus TaxID=439358 RepID=A0AAV7XRN1_9NEOP|nr:hypothetical protein ONE63_007301 [Megalurothrips usitatus]